MYIYIYIYLWWIKIGWFLVSPSSNFNNKYLICQSSLPFTLNTALSPNLPFISPTALRANGKTARGRRLYAPRHWGGQTPPQWTIPLTRRRDVESERLRLRWTQGRAACARLRSCAHLTSAPPGRTSPSLCVCHKTTFFSLAAPTGPQNGLVTLECSSFKQNRREAGRRRYKREVLPTLFLIYLTFLSKDNYSGLLTQQARQPLLWSYLSIFAIFNYLICLA